VGAGSQPGNLMLRDWVLADAGPGGDADVA